MAQYNEIDVLIKKLLSLWDGFPSQNYAQNMSILTNFAHGIKEVTSEGWVMDEPEKLTQYEVCCIPAEAITVVFKRTCYCGIENSLILQQKFPVEPGLKPFPTEKPNSDDVKDYVNFPPYAYLVISSNEHLNEPWTEENINRLFVHQELMHKLIKGHEQPIYDYDEESQTERAMYRGYETSRVLEQPPEVYNRYIFDFH